MAGTQIRVSETTHRIIQSLSAQTGKSMSVIADEAIEKYKREQFFDGLNDDFKALQADEDAWREELEERKLWENTLLDGLESE